MKMVKEAIQEKRSRARPAVYRKVYAYFLIDLRAYISILYYIEGNYPVERTPLARARLRRVLRKGVEKGVLIAGEKKKMSFALVVRILPSRCPHPAEV